MIFKQLKKEDFIEDLNQKVYNDFIIKKNN